MLKEGTVAIPERWTFACALAVASALSSEGVFGTARELDTAPPNFGLFSSAAALQAIAWSLASSGARVSSAVPRRWEEGQQ